MTLSGTASRQTPVHTPVRTPIGTPPVQAVQLTLVRTAGQEVQPNTPTPSNSESDMDTEAMHEFRSNLNRYIHYKITNESEATALIKKLTPIFDKHIDNLKNNDPDNWRRLITQNDFLAEKINKIVTFHNESVASSFISTFRNIIVFGLCGCINVATVLYANVHPSEEKHKVALNIMVTSGTLGILQVPEFLSRYSYDNFFKRPREFRKIIEAPNVTSQEQAV